MPDMDMSDEEREQMEKVARDPAVSSRPPIPASDEDRLSTAVQDKESVHSKSSQRAEAAWDAVPGPEIAIDFPDAGYELVGEDPATGPGYGDKVAPVREIHNSQGDGFTGLIQSGVLNTTPTLGVDVYVSLPDGRSWNLNLAIEEGEKKFTADDIHQAIEEHFDAVAQFMGKAITPTRRALLGLSGLGPARPVKDSPQA